MLWHGKPVLEKLRNAKRCSAMALRFHVSLEEVTEPGPGPAELSTSIEKFLEEVRLLLLVSVGARGKGRSRRQNVERVTQPQPGAESSLGECCS